MDQYRVRASERERQRGEIDVTKRTQTRNKIITGSLLDTPPNLISSNQEWGLGVSMQGRARPRPTNVQGFTKKEIE